MGKFRPKKSEEEFISGSSTKTKAGNSKMLTIRIQPEYLKNLKAMSYAKKSLNQRKIIEKALDQYFADNKEELQKALNIYNQVEE